MSGIKAASKYLLAILMIGVGTLHLVQPEFFVKIMPPYLPWHLELVYLSGFLEAALGLLLLFPRTSRLAAWGIIALLIAVFPANIYLYQHQELLPASPMVHFLRLITPQRLEQQQSDPSSASESPASRRSTRTPARS